MGEGAKSYDDEKCLVLDKAFNTVVFALLIKRRQIYVETLLDGGVYSNIKCLPSPILLTSPGALHWPLYFHLRRLHMYIGDNAGCTALNRARLAEPLKEEKFAYRYMTVYISAENTATLIEPTPLGY